MRPPEARPRPRPPHRPRSRRTPYYTAIPGWGLIDRLPESGERVEHHLELARDRLYAALQVAGWVLAASAILHLVRYAVLMVNRDQPITALVDILTTTLVIAGGVAALVAYVWATVDFVRWLVAERRVAYQEAGGSEPRPRWQLIPMAGIPLVNLVGTGLLGAELVRLTDSEPQARLRARLTRIWVAWTLVTAVAVIAIGVRIAAVSTDSIQRAADGLLAVIISAVVSSVFAFWAADRLPGVLTEAAGHSIPARRWLMIAAPAAAKAPTAPAMQPEAVETDTETDAGVPVA